MAGILCSRQDDPREQQQGKVLGMRDDENEEQVLLWQSKMRIFHYFAVVCKRKGSWGTRMKNDGTNFPNLWVKGTRITSDGTNPDLWGTGHQEHKSQPNLRSVG